MASAAWLTSASGRSARRLAHQPRPAPASVVSAGRAEQREAERLERVLQVVELDELEVLRVDRRERDADGERRLALQVERHLRGRAAVDRLAQRKQGSSFSPICAVRLNHRPAKCSTGRGAVRQLQRRQQDVLHVGRGSGSAGRS